MVRHRAEELIQITSAPLAPRKLSYAGLSTVTPYTQCHDSIITVAGLQFGVATGGSES